MLLLVCTVALGLEYIICKTVEGKFEIISAILHSIQSTLKCLATQVNEIEDAVSEQENRISHLEAKQESIMNEYIQLKKKIDNLENRS